MNGILQAVAFARRADTGPKLREAEARYQMARRIFGRDSAEARAAHRRWQALRGEPAGPR